MVMQLVICPGFAGTRGLLLAYCTQYVNNGNGLIV
jgi:hypothetical protein